MSYTVIKEDLINSAQFYADQAEFYVRNGSDFTVIKPSRAISKTQPFGIYHVH